MTWFEFIIAALALYRFQRLITTDRWPPTVWFRGELDARFGPESSVAYMFHCPWCVGLWACAVFFTINHFYGIPFWVQAIFAGSAVVGFLGEHE